MTVVSSASIPGDPVFVFFMCVLLGGGGLVQFAFRVLGRGGGVRGEGGGAQTDSRKEGKADRNEEPCRRKSRRAR